MKLSVIIPIYCAEDTLDRCVSSIVAQTMVELEIILVDDGSTDSCPHRCDEWARRDSRIHVIHKPNGGLSDARNVGIEASTGEYITFADSDDYIDTDTFQKLIAILELHPEYDILEYPACIYEGGNREHMLTFDNKDYQDIYDYWYSTSAYLHTYAWNKLYKRTLFDHISFPKGKIFEDVYTYPLLLSSSQRIATTSQGLYHYCENPRGITSTADGAAWRMLLDAHMRIIGNPQFLPVTEEYFAHLINIQLYTSELNGDKPRLPRISFCQVRTPKTILYNILGINILCKLNRIFRKIFKRRS